MTSQFITSRSIVALLTVTERSRSAHSASGPLAEAGAGAAAAGRGAHRAPRTARFMSAEPEEVDEAANAVTEDEPALAGERGVVGSNSLALRYGIRPSQHLNITSYYERRQARALENFYALDTAAHAFSMEKTALPTEFRTSPERSPRLLHTGRGKGLRLCWARAAGVRVPVQQT